MEIYSAAEAGESRWNGDLVSQERYREVQTNSAQPRVRHITGYLNVDANRELS
jgi:hypothetical protein